PHTPTLLPYTTLFRSQTVATLTERSTGELGSGKTRRPERGQEPGRDQQSRGSGQEPICDLASARLASEARAEVRVRGSQRLGVADRKSTRLNSSHLGI